MSLRLLIALLVALTMSVSSGCGESSHKKTIHFAKLGLDIPSSYFEGSSGSSPPSGDEDSTVINAVFPNMRPSKSSEWNDPNDVRVTVRRIGKMTSTEFLLSDYERLKYSAAPARPMLVASSATEHKFIVHYSPGSSDVATYVIRTLPDGSQLSLEDPGSWSYSFECNRRVGEVEVTYQFRKNGGPDAATLDVAVVALLERLASFRVIRQ